MQVYAWFMVVFRLSVGVGFAGYILLIMDFTGAGLLLRPLLGPGAALTGAADGSRAPLPILPALAAGPWCCPAPAQPLHAPCCRRHLGTACPACPASPPGLRVQPFRVACPALPDLPAPPALPYPAAAAIWYGLYYGILTRDSAEVATDRIALSLGTGRRMAVSVRNCGICECP